MNILIAEDDPISRKVLEIQVSRQGYTPIVANNGEDALKLVLNQDIDLVLLDIKLPYMSGLDFLKAVRSRDFPKRDIPVIVVTACAFEHEKEPVISIGVTDYITKPYTLEEIRTAIERCKLRIGKKMNSSAILDYCHYVYQFQKIKRYGGVMPFRLMKACDDIAVKDLFENGYLAKCKAKCDDREIDGVILTDKGRIFLEQSLH